MPTVKLRQPLNTSPRDRDLFVSVLDSSGKPAAGAEVLLFLDDLHVGSIRIGASSPSASFRFGATDSEARLVARFGPHALTALVPHQTTDWVFNFPELPELAIGQLQQTAEAKCPDGTTGVPCVLCVVGKQRVRVCI